MVTSVSAPLRRIAVHAAGSKVDLVLPAGDALGHALAVAGVRLQPGDRVLGPGGAVVDPATAASELREGGLYAVTRGTAVSQATERRDRTTGGPPLLAWALVAAALAATVIAHGLPEQSWRWVAAAVIGLSALIWAIVGGARSTKNSRALELVPSLLLGACAGVLCASRDSVGVNAELWDLMFTYALGFGGAALVAVVTAATARGAAARAGAAIAAVLLTIVAILAGLSPLVEWGPTELMIVVSAASVLTIRALPALLVNADDGYYIDYSKHMSLRWTVRGRVPKYIERVDNSRVSDLVTTAEFRLRAAMLVLSVLAAPGIALAVVPLTAGNLFEQIGAGVFLTMSITGLLLVSRRTVAPTLRRPQRIAALIGAGGACLLLTLPGQIAAIPTMVGAGVLALAAAIIAMGSVSLMRGARSLGWSRTGDIVEAIAVVLVLPAGLLAAGTIDVLRGVLN